MSETIMTKSGRTLVMPTPEEDAAINRGIAKDPDTYELSDEEFKQLRPFSERMAERRAAAVKDQPEGRPLIEITISYDADVLETFRATGNGWQLRMNDALRTYLKEHPLKPV